MDVLSTQSHSQPVGYLDVAPDSHIIFRPGDSQAEPPKPSTARKICRTKGIYSHDPVLDRSPDELWRFFVMNLKPPRLAVRLIGEHSDESKSCSNRVTDFFIEIDISHFVTEWSQLYAHPDSGWVEQMTINNDPDGALIEQFGPIGTFTGSNSTAWPTLRETVEEYTSSMNRFKEIRMRKRVLWDTWRVKKSLKALVRSTGYRDSIYVEFPMDDYKVVALASSRSSRCAHSGLVQCLCCMSCLCIGFWPAWAIARKSMDTLTCEYLSTQSADEFLSKNSSAIRDAVLRRSRTRLSAA